MDRFEIIRSTVKKRRKRPANPVFPKTDFGKTSGFPFYMAWLFTSEGTRIFTGSLDRIEEYAIQTIDLCHGIAIVYKYKKPQLRHWMLFGKYSKSIRLRKLARKEKYIEMYSRDSTPVGLSADCLGGGHRRHTRTILRPRTTYELSRKDTNRIYRSYRKFPQHYLRDLEVVIRDIKQNPPIALKKIQKPHYKGMEWLDSHYHLAGLSIPSGRAVVEPEPPGGDRLRHHSAILPGLPGVIPPGVWQEIQDAQGHSDDGTVQ